ncbi:hypothetical protein NL524_30790, partial [Klebsiella pneumoniae]|nr:hypothetical protein [Klebsiella pneumoniae]
MLIFKLDNGGQDSMAVVKKILAEQQANDVKITTEPKEQAALEQLRRDMLPAVFAGQNHIMEDMAVPLSQLA